MPEDLIEKIESIDGDKKAYAAARKQVCSSWADKRDAIQKAVINNDLNQLTKLLEENSHLTIDLSSCYLISGALARTAMTHNNLEMVKLLVEHGDLCTEHTFDKTIAEEAKDKGFTAIADFLDEYVANSYQSLLNDAEKQEQQFSDNNMTQPIDEEQISLSQLGVRP